MINDDDDIMEATMYRLYFSSTTLLLHGSYFNNLTIPRLKSLTFRRRRRKLSSAGKVSGTEFFTAVFEVTWISKQIFSKICANIFMAGVVQVWGDEWEDLVPAVRGTCLREAISGVCERRGVSINLVELQTNLREVWSFHNHVVGPYFSWLKASTTAFTFKNLLRHYAKQVLTHCKLMWNCLA